MTDLEFKQAQILIENLLKTVPKRHQDDCRQESWLAILQGTKPETAVKNYLATEKLHKHKHLKTH